MQVLLPHPRMTLDMERGSISLLTVGDTGRGQRPEVSTGLVPTLKQQHQKDLRGVAWS